MLANFIRLSYFILLALYETQVCFGRSSAQNSYDLCDLGDAITSLNGSIVANKKGIDCTRLILAPKGWRIRFTLYDVWMGNGDSALYFYDGGTIHGTRSVGYSVKENVDGDEDTIYSTSNALVLHTDKITLQETRLNGTFVMFPHSSKWCSCPAVVQGQTECTLTTALRRSGDSLERHCKTTCEQGYKTIIKGSSFGDTAQRDLQLICKRNLGKKEAIWEATSNALEFKKLVTCSKANPATQILSDFKFDYNNISCEDIDLEYIRRKVSEYIVNGTDHLYTGECFKSKEMANNLNCTVRRVNVSCSSPNNYSSRIQLRVEDNILMLANLTLTKEIYGKFYTKFGNLLSSLGGYVTEYVSVNNRNATNFALISDRVTTCPGDNVLIYINERKCLSCPMHYEKQSTYINLYFGCSKCPDGQRRKLSEQRCVVGPQNYPKAHCQHQCALGKFFSNDSGICEWCPYGMFQNSTTSVNPVCRSCPGGKSTGFVGAKNEADCIDVCRAGQYFKNPGCVKCVIGYFMPNENNRFVKCYQCNSGMTTLNVGTKNETDCIKKCSLGEYFNISQGICAVCPNNTYQDEVKVNNTRNCKTCPANTVTLSPGSRSSSACLGQCAPGRYVDIQVKSCELCPRNTYQDMADHASFSCKPCDKYKIIQNDGSMNISMCIYSCSQGEFFNKTSKSCEKCGINTYQDEVGKDFCNSCPGKTFTVKLSSKQCLDPCQFGQFLNKSAEQCQDCPNGYYQNISDYMSENCFPCPLDFYNDKLGRRNCTACPDRTITIVTGATRPSECIGTCKPGSFLNKSRKSCQECLKGFYQDQKDYRFEHCTKCPSANLTTLEAGASTLAQCVGYCASFPCLNGGECSNIDNDFNCTCPKFIKGKRCEMITDEKDTDEMEVAIRFPGLVWNQNLSNPQSKEFVELAKDIENSVRQEFKNDKSFRTVKVKEFRQGSVISDLELNYVAGIDFKTPVDTLSSAIADGKLGNLTADNSSVNLLNFTCTTPLGMENGRIPDEAITSANNESDHPPSDARLNRNGPGWAPKILYLKDAYLQVDFQEVVELTGIGIQGSSYKGGSWLHNYYLDYSSDGGSWLEYKENVAYAKLFKGNTDVDTVVRSQLKYPVRTRYVRIKEYRFKNKLSFRIEFYGCPIPKTVILPTLFPTAPSGTTATGTTATGTTATGTTATGTTATGTTATGAAATGTTATGTTATGTAATDSTAKSHSTLKSDDDDDDDDSNVGLIVGLVLGLFVLILLVAVAVWWMKKKKASHNFGSTANAMQLKSKS